MKGVQTFEMKIVSTSDLLKYHRSRLVRFVPWVMLGVVGISGKRLVLNPLDFEAWVSFLFAGYMIICRWFPGWFPQPKSRSVVLNETTIRFPVKVHGTMEIPRAQVSEVSPMSSGLIIAWKKDGAPWYTQLSQYDFEPSVWSEFREVLVEWGNRGSEG
jgi:hypothetical protein